MAQYSNTWTNDSLVLIVLCTLKIDIIWKWKIKWYSLIDCTMVVNLLNDVVFIEIIVWLAQCSINISLGSIWNDLELL